MPTFFGSGLAHASAGEVAMSVVLAVVFAALGYRMSARHRMVRGVTPWRIPSIAWAVICLFLQFIGLAIEVVAELTTRSPYSPATPAERPEQHYAPPTSAPRLPGIASTGDGGGGLEDLPAPEVTGSGYPPPAADASGAPASFGWYADPTGRHERRYFDGRCWSEHVLDASTLARDPL